jgi:SRSO17 transposase
MTEAELAGWADAFAEFGGRFGDLFRRREPRAEAERYLRGLLLPVERKNGWQLAEAVGNRHVDGTQRLLYQARWSADAALDRLLQFVVEEFGHPEGILVLDETGFLKKGDKSVGVQRQYSGTAGKVENCQLGVFCSYLTPTAHLLVDRALYLPQGWCADEERCRAAHVPPEVGFATKPQLALQLLRRVLAAGLPAAWITADEAYGDNPELRRSIDEELGRRYVLAVSCSTPVWTTRPETELSQRQRPRLAPGAPAWETVQAVVASWPGAAWQRLTVSEGEQGPIAYDWAAERVIESRQSLPGGDVWLLARRSLSDPSEVAYYLSNAPSDAALPALAWVASRRYSIEQCFAEAKGEVGLDHYEVRYWHSWHRHLTLSMMALAFLVWVRAGAATTGSGGR